MRRAPSESWPAAIVFDLDGTLVDSAPDLAGALNDLLAEEGLAPLDVASVRRMIGDGIEKLCERGFAARGRILAADETRGMAARFLGLYEPRATRDTALFPQVRETIEALARAGLRLAVLTNKPTNASRLILGGLDIGSSFATVMGGDGGFPKKPDPACLLAVIERLGVGPESALMVGDSIADVSTARAAGIPVVVVGHGYTIVPPHDLGADRVIADLGDLGAAIDSLRAEQTAPTLG